jgi:hypothetical protein
MLTGTELSLKVAVVMRADRAVLILAINQTLYVFLVDASVAIPLVVNVDDR